jgi:SNF2 family DNA or RNA helicase
MRLGKSLTCLRWLDTKNLNGPILIVAPLTVLCGWERELLLEGKSYCWVAGSKPDQRTSLLQDNDAQYKLVNYELLLRLNCLKKMRLGAVILDESVVIKNPQSKTAKFCLRYLSRNSDYRAILTGLPAPESELELWTQFAFLHGGEWMGHSNYWSWRKKYARQYGFDWIVPSKELLKIRQAFHEDAYIITRKMANMGNKKIRQIRRGDMHPSVSRVYKHALKTWEIPGAEAKYTVAVVSWLRRMASGCMPGNRFMPCWKYDELLRILKQELPNDQVVVWFAYNAELTRTWRMLKEEGISATWITGRTKLEQRRKRMRMFERGSRRVMLCQVRCGRYGLDFSVADTAVYLSSPCSYDTRRQSEDRVESIHKNTDQLIIDMITNGTTDEIVAEALQDKKAGVAYLMGRIEDIRFNRKGSLK